MSISISALLRSPTTTMVALAALTASWAVALAVSNRSAWAQTTSDGGLTVIALVCSATAALHTSSLPRAERHLWRYLALSALCWGLAGTLVGWRGWGAIFSENQHVPVAAVALYQASGVAALVAVLPLLRKGTTIVALVRDFLDSALVTAALSALIWFAVLPVAGVGQVASIPQMLVLTFEVLVVVIAVHGALRSRQHRVGLWLLSAALLSLAVADLTTVVPGPWRHRSPGDITAWGWFTAMTLLSVAVALRARRPCPAPASSHRGRSSIPYVAVLLSLVVSLSSAALDEDGAGFTSWLQAVVLVLVVARTLMAMRDADHLARRLQGRVAASTRQLDSSQRRFASLVAHSTDLVCVIDADGVLSYVSPSARQVLGRDAADLTGVRVAKLLAPGQLRSAMQARTALLGGDGSPRHLRAAALHASGRRVLLHVTLTDLRWDPAVQGIVVNARDITDAATLEAELSRAAFSDSLTGLPNRALFADRLTHALRSRPERGPVTVCYLDLDGFKAVNDSLGHGAGDELLTLVTQRLLGVVREGDTVARLGGDEFAVLLQEPARPVETGARKEPESTSVTSEGVEAERLASRICASMRLPFTVRDVEVHIASSVGVASTCTAGRDAEQLMSAADLAMYRAKGERRGGYAVYDPQMHEQLLEQVQLEADLRRALEENQLRVAYQPLVDMTTGAVLGVEALARWHHPVRGVVPPTAFIPVAEATGLVDAIGEVVLREACTRVATWRRELPGAEALRVSVNISGHQLRTPGLVEVVLDALQVSGLPATALVLEITESFFVDQHQTSLEALHALRALGVRLAIDDFGTGYSSLSYLHRLPVDILKIDKSFVDELSATGDPSLVDAIIGMADTLGLVTVAEGVEHEHQRAALASQGCATGQGYHFSPPVAPELVPDLVLAALHRTSAHPPRTGPATSPATSPAAFDPHL